MKNLILLLLIAFCSCQKTQEHTTETYTLQFVVSEDSPTDYLVQTRKPGSAAFEQAGVVKYDQSRHGSYQVELDLAPEEQVRLQAVSPKESVYSTILVAR